MGSVESYWMMGEIQAWVWSSEKQPKVQRFQSVMANQRVLRRLQAPHWRDHHHEALDLAL